MAAHATLSLSTLSLSTLSLTALSRPALVLPTVAETITVLEARLAEAETDSEKVKALNALVWELRAVNPHRALSLSEEAAGLARALTDQSGLAASLCLVGVCASLLSRHQEAREALKEGLALSRRQRDLGTEARCLHYIGVVHYYLAEHAEAIENVMAALQIRENQQDWEGLGTGFNMLGNIQFCLSDYGQALDWYQRSLEAREQAGDQIGIAMSLGNIGNVYSTRGDFAEALSFHQRSLDQSVRIGNTASVVCTLCNLGGDHVDMGRYEEAIEACRRSVALGETLEDWKQVSVALTNMGYALGKTGRQAEALEYFARALDLARSLQDQDVAVEILLYAGLTHAGLGELVEARVRLAEAAVLAASLGARGTALQAAEGLSEVCKRQGDYAAALGHYETFRRLEKEVFSEEAADRAKALVVKMEVEHHRHEAEALAKINTALQFSNTALQKANARLEALATTDHLTGLPNHRTLVAALDAETARARREGGPCALLFLDIDHFKSVNDTHGHSVGDAVLAEFAACVRACLREDDILGRWGGEEFLVLLPGRDAEEALWIGERVRAAVADHRLAAKEGLSMTCSIGAVACPPQEAVRHSLVEAADQALYAAKRLGRNQVRAAGDPAILSLAGPLFPNQSNSVRHGAASSASARRA